MMRNRPARVEVATANVYADQIEWICRNIKNRDSLIVSLHTHNDRCTGVAATELGLLAGAGPGVGALVGNGGRTGKLDVGSPALCLSTHRVNPTLAFANPHGVLLVFQRSTRIT